MRKSELEAWVLNGIDSFEAGQLVGDMQYDAFGAFMSVLHESYPAECFAYLTQVVSQHSDAVIRRNAYRFLANNYDLTRRDILDLAPHLGDGTSLIESPEVVSFVKSQMLNTSEFYGLHTQVDDLSCGARIESITVLGIRYEMKVRGRLDFFGTMLIEALKKFGITRCSFTGTFEGYFDELGVYLESAHLDVSSTRGAWS